MFVKTFSRGAMTIPKKVRDEWGVAGKIWLELSFDKNQLVVKPAGRNTKGTWTKQDERDRFRARVEWDKRLAEYDRLLEQI